MPRKTFGRSATRPQGRTDAPAPDTRISKETMKPRPRRGFIYARTANASVNAPFTLSGKFLIRAQLRSRWGGRTSPSAAHDAAPRWREARC